MLLMRSGLTVTPYGGKMRPILGFVVCASLVVACADQPPPRDPSSTSSTTNTTSTETERSVTRTPVQTSAQTTTMTPAPTPLAPVNEAPDLRATPAPEDSTLGPRSTPMAGDSTATGKAVDNTKNNARDREGTLTPGDQGNTASETKITADIRKALMASNGLSFNAKNAKIITTGTKVTLRGVVKTDAEKAEIERVAKATYGVSDVDNQLEVKK